MSWYQLNHYGDVIMGVMASQITSLTIVDSSLFGCKSNKISKFRVTGLCAGNLPGTGEFPAQMASVAKNVSIWWRHHAMLEKGVIGVHFSNDHLTLRDSLSGSRLITNLIDGVVQLGANVTMRPVYNGTCRRTLQGVISSQWIHYSSYVIGSW